MALAVQSIFLAERKRADISSNIKIYRYPKKNTYGGITLPYVFFCVFSMFHNPSEDRDIKIYLLNNIILNYIR